MHYSAQGADVLVYVQPLPIKSKSLVTAALRQTPRRHTPQIKDTTWLRY